MKNMLCFFILVYGCIHHFLGIASLGIVRF